MVVYYHSPATQEAGRQEEETAWVRQQTQQQDKN